jgi:hypothetical protein
VAAVQLLLHRFGALTDILELHPLAIDISGGGMAQLKDIIQWRTVSGSPVTVGGVTVIPQSQALTLRWPFGGFVWNRPVAILVERGGLRSVERVPVVDVTRIAQLGLLSFSLVFSIAVLTRAARRKE